MSEASPKPVSPPALSSSGTPSLEPSLSLVVPVYNERDNVAPLIAEIVAALRGRPAGQGGDFVQTTLDTPGMEEPAAAPDGSTGGGTERSYRRMPGVAQLLADYERIGTVTGLAQHYGVPRHTAQGWMGRARKRAAQQAAGGSR